MAPSCVMLWQTHRVYPGLWFENEEFLPYVKFNFCCLEIRMRMATAAELETGFKVEKLNEDNFHSWKFDMKMYLIGKDVWEIVNGTETLGEAASAEEQRKFKKRKN